MMSIDQLAKIAYEAHIKATDPKRNGFNVQPWEHLDTRFRAGWIAAVQAVRAELARH